MVLFSVFLKERRRGSPTVDDDFNITNLRHLGPWTKSYFSVMSFYGFFAVEMCYSDARVQAERKTLIPYELIIIEFHPFILYTVLTHPSPILSYFTPPSDCVIPPSLHSYCLIPLPIEMSQMKLVWGLHNVRKATIFLTLQYVIRNAPPRTTAFKCSDDRFLLQIRKNLGPTQRN